MPLEIKNKRTKKVEANGVVCNSLICGHCNQPVLEGTTWIALDDPYHCIIHEPCVSLFNYDEKLRTAKSEGRKKAIKEMDDIVETVNQMVTRPWFQKRGVPKAYQEALQQLVMVHQALRTSGVIVDKETQ